MEEIFKLFEDADVCYHCGGTGYRFEKEKVYRYDKIIWCSERKRCTCCKGSGKYPGKKNTR